MSARSKIWSAVGLLSFAVISGIAIATPRNGAFAEQSSENSTQLSSASVAPSPVETVDINKRFLSAIESSVSSETRALVKEIPDSQKITAGEKICQAFTQGVTFNDLAVAFIQEYGTNPVSAEYAGALIGASIAAYCPEYAYKLPSRQ